MRNLYEIMYCFTKKDGTYDKVYRSYHYGNSEEEAVREMAKMEKFNKSPDLLGITPFIKVVHDIKQYLVDLTNGIVRTIEYDYEKERYYTGYYTLMLDKDGGYFEDKYGKHYVDYTNSKFIY